MASRMQQLRGKFRRLYLTLLRPGYVRRQRQRRRGECLRCGRCCRLAVRCPLLEGRDRCRIYGLARPRACTGFPVDERDLADVDGRCGFYFADEPAAEEALSGARRGGERA